MIPQILSRSMSQRRLTEQESIWKPRGSCHENLPFPLNVCVCFPPTRKAPAAHSLVSRLCLLHEGSTAQQCPNKAALGPEAVCTVCSVAASQEGSKIKAHCKYSSELAVTASGPSFCIQYPINIRSQHTS